MSYVDKRFPGLGPEGFLGIGYREWGDASAGRVLICIHGLSQNRRHFDAIAEALADDYRVLSLDMPGRGDHRGRQGVSATLSGDYSGSPAFKRPSRWCARSDSCL